jgi:ribosomal protein S18 acetylase RimI-like enzyme
MQSPQAYADILRHAQRASFDFTRPFLLDHARRDVEPHFKELLRCHWMEEAQHARMDTLIVELLAAERTPAERAQALEGYLSIGALVAGGLAQQLELAAFEAKVGRTLAEEDAAALRAIQLPANHFTYLASGTRHPRFQRTALGPELLARVQEVAPAFC